MKDKGFTKSIIILLVIALFVVGITIGGYLFFKSNFSRILPSENIEVYLARKDVCTIVFDDDNIWAAGATGLFVLQPDGFDNNGEVKYKESEVGNLSYVRDLILYDNQVLVAYDEGVLVVEGDGKSEDFKSDNFELIDAGYNERLPDQRVNSLFVDSDGLLWVGTWGGVVVFDGDTVVDQYTKDDGIAHSMVNKIFEDSHGNIWLGSYVAPDGGITIIERKNDNKYIFSIENGLLHSNINDILEINNSLLFVGGGLYNRGGITSFSYDGTSWNINGYLQKDDGLAGEKVRSMTLDSNNRVWLGSEYDGVAIFDFIKNSELTTELNLELDRVMTTKDGLSHNEVKVIKEDKTGNVWLGTLKGLVKISKGEFK